MNGLVLNFENLLEEKHVEALKKITSNLNFQANPSFVYDVKEGINIIYDKVRKSKTFIVKDSNLLEFINDTIVEKLNQKIREEYTIELARKYVTFIRYDKDDFFDWHNDFEKVKINNGMSNFKEMHLIYCINAPVKGGKFLIKDKKAFDCKKNSAIIFDKLLDHKGDVIEEGHKIIMTIDVFVTSKIRSESGIIQEVEEELFELIEGNNPWMIFDDKYEQLVKVIKQIRENFPEKSKDIVPFIQIRVT